MDQGYSNLLNNLHRPNGHLPLESLSYHLAHLEPPTALAASAVSSPLFLTTFTLDNLQALSTAFRHATHIVYTDANKSQSSIISQSTSTRLARWVSDVLKGFQGGHSLVRFAACGGLLLGLEEVLKAENVQISVRGRVEDQVLLALADVMDLYRYEYEHPSTPWEGEFDNTRVKVLPLTLVLSSQFLPFVSSNKQKALPLNVLSHILCSNLISTFNSGSVLSSPSSTTSLTAPLSKLAASTLSLLLDSRPKEGLLAADEILLAYKRMARTAEQEWNRIKPGKDAQETWLTIKTFLFSTIMIADAILSAAVFIRPSIYTSLPSPFSLALITLQTFSHLSFVISQFGLGSLNSKDAVGFKELNRAFYQALDILSAQGIEGERYITAVVKDHKEKDTEGKTAYILACMEQLVPVLSEKCIEETVWPFCQPHLYDPSHRETYEAAHSVFVGLLFERAKTRPESSEDTEFTFTDRLVPFYIQCLIDNSHQDQLATDQLCIAFHALVASSSHPTLTWYIISTLLDAINSPSPSPALRHMLVSSISALPLGILEGVLEVVGSESWKDLEGEIYKEIVERVGDAEREVVLRWWCARFPPTKGTMTTTEAVEVSRL